MRTPKRGFRGADSSRTSGFGGEPIYRKEYPTAQEKTLEQTSIVSVTVSGKLGVLGAKVTLSDETGRIVALREIGSNVATGCRGPNTVNLAVREPGKYTLTVRYSDGLTKTWPVEARPAQNLPLQASRDAATPASGK